MATVDRWQLPDGVEEVLPARAETVERLRRQLLDLYHSWGYQLVIPPLMEFTESLLTGLGQDLDLLTFRGTLMLMVGLDLEVRVGEVLDESGNVGRVVLQVSVERGGDLTAHRPESGLERTALPVLAVEGEDPDAAVHGRDLAHVFEASVTASIVDEEQLDASGLISQHLEDLAVEGLEGVALVVDGDDDAQPRRGIRGQAIPFGGGSVAWGRGESASRSSYGRSGDPPKGVRNSGRRKSAATGRRMPGPAAIWLARPFAALLPAGIASWQIAVWRRYASKSWASRRRRRLS